MNDDPTAREVIATAQRTVWKKIKKARREVIWGKIWVTYCLIGTPLLIWQGAGLGWIMAMICFAGLNGYTLRMWKAQLNDLYRSYDVLFEWGRELADR